MALGRKRIDSITAGVVLWSIHGGLLSWSDGFKSQVWVSKVYFDFRAPFTKFKHANLPTTSLLSLWHGRGCIKAMMTIVAKAISYQPNSRGTLLSFHRATFISQSYFHFTGRYFHYTLEISSSHLRSILNLIAHICTYLRWGTVALINHQAW